MGELAALRRADLNLTECTVKIERSMTELFGGGRLYGPPKSAAGRRTVSIPEVIMCDVTGHLDQFTGPDNDDLIFTSPGGAPLHHGNFRRRVWLPTVMATGLVLQRQPVTFSSAVVVAAPGGGLVDPAPV
jgi:hypothetical protein